MMVFVIVYFIFYFDNSYIFLSDFYKLVCLEFFKVFEIFFYNIVCFFYECFVKISFFVLF